MTVAGIILAAGASRRMGMPKALAKIGGATFLERVASALAKGGIGETVLVLGADEGVIVPEIGWFGGTIVINGAWREGQASSVAAGVGALDPSKIAGALIAPVDHPLVTADLIAQLLAAFRSAPEKIILPVCRGRRGHPVVFPSRLFGELVNAPRDEGIRHVVRSHPADILELPTADDAVLRNLDTPADLPP